MTSTEKQFDINNEYHTLLETFKMDNVYDGFEVSLYKVESNIDNPTYYESKVSSTHFTFKPLRFDTLDEMKRFYDEWKLGPSNTDED